MPFVQRQPQRRVAQNHEYLVERLIKEFQPKSLSLAALDHGKVLPVIIEEQMRNSDRIQIYVIWSEWSGIREDLRSSAILDAYERHFGKDSAARIVVAFGLTPEEAEKLGIQE